MNIKFREEYICSHDMWGITGSVRIGSDFYKNSQYFEDEPTFTVITLAKAEIATELEAKYRELQGEAP